MLMMDVDSLGPDSMLKGEDAVSITSKERNMKNYRFDEQALSDQG